MNKSPVVYVEQEEHRSSGVQEFRSSGVQEFRKILKERTCLEIRATIGSKAYNPSPLS